MSTPPIDPPADHTATEDQHLSVTERKTSAAGVRAVAVSMLRSLRQQGPRKTAKNLLGLNQVDGFDCMSCAWPDSSAAYTTPKGCVAAYYPETNPLIPLDFVRPLDQPPARLTGRGRTTPGP